MTNDSDLGISFISNKVLFIHPSFSFSFPILWPALKSAFLDHSSRFSEFPCGVLKVPASHLRIKRSATPTAPIWQREKVDTCLRAAAAVFFLAQK
jgi:hypothetical protein